MKLPNNNYTNALKSTKRVLPQTTMQKTTSICKQYPNPNNDPQKGRFNETPK